MTNPAYGWQFSTAVLTLLYWYTIVLPNVFLYFYKKSEIKRKNIITKTGFFIIATAIFLFLQWSSMNSPLIISFGDTLLMAGFFAIYGVLWMFFFFLPVAKMANNSIDINELIYKAMVQGALLLLTCHFTLKYFNWG